MVSSCYYCNSFHQLTSSVLLNCKNECIEAEQSHCTPSFAIILPVSRFPLTVLEAEDVSGPCWISFSPVVLLAVKNLRSSWESTGPEETRVRVKSCHSSDSWSSGSLSVVDSGTSWMLYSTGSMSIPQSGLPPGAGKADVHYSGVH